MARTSVTTTIQRIRRQLQSGYRFEANYLNGAIGMGDTTIALSITPTAGLQPGAIVYVDLEAMRVLTVNQSSSTMTVQRAIYDSTPAAHTSGSEVVINPRFSPLDIFDALQEEIASYGPQLYRVDADEFAVAEVDDILQLPAAWSDCYGIIDVRRKWADTGVESWPRLQCRFQRSGPTATGGNSILRFTESVLTGTVYVQVARPFVLTGFDLTKDLVTDVLLPDSMLDVVGMGTKFRLLVDNENGRTARSAQDEPRRAEEIPVGSTVQPLQLNNALYRNRKQEEVNKLRAMWPVRIA